MTTTQQGGQTTEVLSGKLKIDEVNNRLVLDDGTVYRMIIGLLPDGTIGMIVSKEGVDVFTVFS